MPSGPTLVDEIANFAFWVGLMKGIDPADRKFWRHVDFREAKDNFIRAARTGMHSVLMWKGEAYDVQRLILDKLIPLSWKGLERNGVAKKDIEKYLGIIRKRVESRQTGAEWQIHRFRTLLKKNNSNCATRQLVRDMLWYQESNIPVHEWEVDTRVVVSAPEKEILVEDLMQTDIFSVNEEVSIQVALQVMDWKEIHHLPIENHNKDLVGSVTKHQIGDMSQSEQSSPLKEVMNKEMPIVKITDTIGQVMATMKDHKEDYVLIVEDGKLCGILTEADLTAQKEYKPNVIEERLAQA